MHGLLPALRRLRIDERGVSSVEYALILSMIGGGIVFSAALLGSAISNEMTEIAELLADSDGCGNAGGGDGTGGDNQTGMGGGNTC